MKSRVWGVEGGTGEEAEGQVVLLAGAAEAVDGLIELEGGLGEIAGGVALDAEEVGAAEREVVEGDGEGPEVDVGPLQLLCDAFPRLGIAALIEQDVAIPEAPDRVEQRIGRLSFVLYPLGFLELRGGFLLEAHRVQGRAKRRPAGHASKGIAALIGKLEALPGLRQSLVQFAVGLEKLADVGGADSSVLRVLLREAQLEAQPQEPGGLRQPAERPERRTRLVQDKRLPGFAEPRREPLPRRIEEGGEDGNLAAEGSEFLQTEVLFLALDASPVDLVERLLPLPRQAPVHQRRIERGVASFDRASDPVRGHGERSTAAHGRQTERRRGP